LLNGGEIDLLLIAHCMHSIAASFGFYGFSISRREGINVFSVMQTADEERIRPDYSPAVLNVFGVLQNLSPMFDATFEQLCRF